MARLAVSKMVCILFPEPWHHVQVVYDPSPPKTQRRAKAMEPYAVRPDVVGTARMCALRNRLPLGAMHVVRKRVLIVYFKVALFFYFEVATVKVHGRVETHYLVGLPCWSVMSVIAGHIKQVYGSRQCASARAAQRCSSR